MFLAKKVQRQQCMSFCLEWHQFHMVTVETKISKKKKMMQVEFSKFQRHLYLSHSFKVKYSQMDCHI